MVNKKSELVERQEVIDDLAEVLNNLQDDLDFETPLDGYKGSYNPYEESYKAVKRYTLKILRQKFKKYGGKLYS